MCNACGFLCCASDVFGGCGCDHCHEPACRDDDEDDFDPVWDELVENAPRERAATALKARQPDRRAERETEKEP